MKIKHILVLSLLLTVMLCGAVSSFAEVITPQSDYYLKGIDLTGLKDEQKETVINILKEHNCPCGCKKGALLTCRNSDDENCGVSRKMAEFVKEKVAAGEDENAVSKALEAELNRIALRIKNKREKYNKVYNIDITNANYYGRKDAKLPLIVFLDYECPFCTKGYNLYKKLVDEIPDKVRFVFMHLPLSMHKGAVPFAVAAEAAGAQGKFFEFSDLLMNNKGKYSDERVIGFAKELGLDIDKFKKDMADEAILAKVNASKREAARNGITATPSIILNKRMIRNKSDINYFKQNIQIELGKLKASQGKK